MQRGVFFFLSQKLTGHSQCFGFLFFLLLLNTKSGVSWLVLIKIDHLEWCRVAAALGPYCVPKAIPAFCRDGKAAHWSFHSLPVFTSIHIQ